MKKLIIPLTIVTSLALTATAVLAADTVTGEMKPVPYVGANYVNGGNQHPVETTADNIIRGNQSANEENQGIEYTKASYIADGKVYAVVEDWVNLGTQDKRRDMMAKEDNGTIHPISQYLKDNGTKWEEVSRDNSGKALSGKYMELSKEETMRVDSWGSFADAKAEFAKAGWQNEGVVESADGQKLIKLYGQGMLEDDRQPAGSKVVMSEYAYIDQNTGLPVKVESYAEVDGVKTLQYTVVYEHKYVNDESLLDTTGIDLQKYSKLQWVNGVEY